MEWGSGSGSRPEVDSKAARQARPTRALLRRPADPPQPATRAVPPHSCQGLCASSRGPPWLRRPPPPPAVRAPFTHQRRGRQSLAHSGAARAASGSGAGPWARRLRGGCPQLAPGLCPPGRRCFPSSPDDPLPPDGAGSLEGPRLEALQRCGVEGSAGFDARPALSSAAPAAENAGNLPMGGLGAVLQ